MLPRRSLVTRWLFVIMLGSFSVWLVSVVTDISGQSGAPFGTPLERRELLQTAEDYLKVKATALLSVRSSTPPRADKKTERSRTHHHDTQINKTLEQLQSNMTLHKANKTLLANIVRRANIKSAEAPVGGANPDDPVTGGPVANPHPFRYVINSANVCRQAAPVFLIVYVHTAPAHVKRRMVIRQTWGNHRKYDDLAVVRLVFIMGIDSTSTQKKASASGQTDASAAAQQALYFEADRYNDIVQEDFLDSYRNLTYKGVAALKWLSTYCSGAKFVLKTDDDIFVNMFTYLRHLLSIHKLGNSSAVNQRVDHAPNASQSRAEHALNTSQSGGDHALNTRRSAPMRESFDIMCLVWHRMVVMRTGKWKVSETEFKDKYYPTYCSGSAYSLSMWAALRMHSASYRVPFFWVDDFYITGLLPMRAGLSHKQFMSTYVLDGRKLEEKFTGPQWYTYIFSHVHDLDAIQSVWRRLTRLARGVDRPQVRYALPGHLPNVKYKTPQ